MINSHKVQHIFFDLDHTLWDFEKNSGATFKSIFEELNFDFSLEVFLDFYNPINHYYWKQGFARLGTDKTCTKNESKY